MLEWLNYNRPDVTWLKGPDDNGNYDWDNSLPNQQQIQTLIDSYQEDWENPAPATIADESVKKTAIIQYIKLDSNTSSGYLYSWSQHRTNFNVVSGNDENGFRFRDSSPILVPFKATIKNITIKCRGVAVSERSPDSVCNLNFELNDQLTTGKHNNLAEIKVPFETTNLKVGSLWNASLETDLLVSQKLDIPVELGQLLGLKFVSVQGSSDIVSYYNMIVTMELEENV